MVTSNGTFQELAIEDKIDFFLHCQKLLVEHHPTSPFIFHTGNVETRLKHIQGFVSNYQGFYYQDENVCALYNKIIISDPLSPEHALRQHMYKPPAENYNAITIDFVVFRDLKDCLTFVKGHYEAKVQYILFVKNNKVKIYPTIDFLQQILNLPVV